MKRLFVGLLLFGIGSPVFSQDLKFVDLYQYLDAYEVSKIKTTPTTIQTDSDSKYWVNTTNPATYFTRSIADNGDGNVKEDFFGAPTSTADSSLGISAYGSGAATTGDLVNEIKCNTNSKLLCPTAIHCETKERADGSYSECTVENNLNGTADIQFKARFDTDDFEDLKDDGQFADCKVTIHVVNKANGQKALNVEMEWDGVEGKWVFSGHYRTSGGTWTAITTNSIYGSVYNKTYSGWLTNVTNLSDIETTITFNEFDIDQKHTASSTHQEDTWVTGRVYYESNQ